MRPIDYNGHIALDSNTEADAEPDKPHETPPTIPTSTN